jgi:hypothetical protein
MVMEKEGTPPRTSLESIRLAEADDAEYVFAVTSEDTE